MNEPTVIQSLPARQSADPSQLIQMALTSNANIETLERLFTLQKDWEANEARKSFVKAMVGFKSEPMVIEKRKLVSFETSTGTTQYHHAELSDVVAVMIPAMAKHGLSHRWTVEQEATDITVTCILTHCQGHSESVSMTARPDASGGKNAIQAIASAVSYLQRYTLLAAGGMATCGMDNDGRGYEGGHTIDPKVTELIESATAAAKQGKKAIKAWWDAASTEDRASISHMIAELQATASAVDASKSEAGNDSAE